MGEVSGLDMALLLNQQISAVVTAMRQNSRWAMVPTRYTVSRSGQYVSNAELF
jgi:hypothetical protein